VRSVPGRAGPGSRRRPGQSRLRRWRCYRLEIIEGTGFFAIVWVSVSIGWLVKLGSEALSLKVDEVTIGSYPRDDVFYSWVKDGRARAGTATICVRTADGSLKQVGELVLGSLDVLHPAVEVGAEIVVDLHGLFDGQVYERQVTFVATGDEVHDVCISAVGPGARAEPKTGRLFKKTHYSGFEFGVLAMAVTTEQGTRVMGRSGPLIEHDPGDGVGLS
jgi:hypothetical protein